MAELTVDHLRRDHQEARKVMAQFESLLAQLDQDPCWTSERRAAFEAVQDFLTGPLALLIRKKDEILYPALGALFPLDEGPLALLRDEHAALTAHFREACRAGNSLSQGEDQDQNLRALRTSGRKGIEILQDHLYKEEKVLFPMVARHLAPARDAELLRRMNDHKPE
jgi:hemerythrin-like domain-containing protein